MSNRNRHRRDRRQTADARRQTADSQTETRNLCFRILEIMKCRKNIKVASRPMDSITMLPQLTGTKKKRRTGSCGYLTMRALVGLRHKEPWPALLVKGYYTL